VLRVLGARLLAWTLRWYARALGRGVNAAANARQVFRRLDPGAGLAFAALCPFVTRDAPEFAVPAEGDLPGFFAEALESFRSGDAACLAGLEIEGEEGESARIARLVADACRRLPEDHRGWEGLVDYLDGL